MSVYAWKEGRHAQIDFRYGSAWIGVTFERLMLGVVVNTDSRTLGFALGPVYFGLGA